MHARINHQSLISAFQTLASKWNLAWCRSPRLACIEGLSDV